MDNNKLEQKLIDFTVSAIDLAEKLPSSPAGKHLGGQLIRSSSSMALNYAEAQGAESRKDFKHKIKVVLKEARESHVCLRVINKKKGFRDNVIVQSVLDEANQIVSIFVKMSQTLDDA